MKTTYLIATTVIGFALAAPLAAHHNAPFELEIGDMMDRHEDAIENLNLIGNMDPSNGAGNDNDGSRINDVDPQPNGIQGSDASGVETGGSRGGVPW